jgi:hypothetical protein
MFNTEKQNALHKAQLYRLLISLLDNKKIKEALAQQCLVFWIGFQLI